MLPSLLESLEGYTWPNGVVTLNSPPSLDDNPYLFTATAWFLAEKLGESSLKWWRANELFLSMQIKPGLYRPLTTWKDRTLSHDEINGIASMSRNHAIGLYEYGRRHFWVYNARGRWQDLGEEWVYRMGYLVPFIRVRAGEAVPLHEQLWYAAEVLAAIRLPRGETSRRCLFVLHSATPMPKIMAWAYAKFRAHINRDYGGLGGLYAIYYGPTHPFTTHTQGVQL